MFLHSLVVEILNQRGTVMSFDELPKNSGQPVFLGNLNAVLDVSDDNQLAHGRRKLGVAAGRTQFVLDKVIGFVDLSDVMIISADSAQKSVSPDRLGARFSY